MIKMKPKKMCPVLQTIEYLKERTLTFSPGTKSLVYQSLHTNLAKGGL
jgi:hypothetical protein